MSQTPATLCLSCVAELGFLEVQAGKGGELTRDETTIIRGALELTEKVARDVMTPLSETFAIDINANLDRLDANTNFILPLSSILINMLIMKTMQQLDQVNSGEGA